MPTSVQKRNAVTGKYKSILGRNKYSQSLRDYCFKQYTDGNYYSDCSSSISYCYRQAGYGFGILNTVGMYNSTKLTDVGVIIKNGIIQNPEVLRVGDMLLFAGTDSSRKSAGYVGHVEMVYAISGATVTLAGHGSGKPSTKKMNTYCRSRYNSKTKTALGNKGLIRVRRFIVDDVAPIPDDGEKKVEIVGGNCYVRTAPNTTGAKLGIAKRGDAFVYAGKTFENGWLSVIYNGQTAYLSGKYGKIVE